MNLPGAGLQRGNDCKVAWGNFLGWYNVLNPACIGGYTIVNICRSHHKNPWILLNQKYIPTELIFENWKEEIAWGKCLFVLLFRGRNRLKVSDLHKVTQPVNWTYTCSALRPRTNSIQTGRNLRSTLFPLSAPVAVSCLEKTGNTYLQHIYK